MRLVSESTIDNFLRNIEGIASDDFTIQFRQGR
jgi:hypothetical protein